MIRDISAKAIRNPVPPVVLFVVLFFMGVVAFIRLPVNLSPDISFPLIQVVVEQPGAAPPEIETQILQKIEGSVASVGNVKSITSAALEGQAGDGPGGAEIDTRVGHHASVLARRLDEHDGGVGGDRFDEGRGELAGEQLRQDGGIDQSANQRVVGVGR